MIFFPNAKVLRHVLLFRVAIVWSVMRKTDDDIDPCNKVVLVMLLLFWTEKGVLQYEKESRSTDAFSGACAEPDNGQDV